MTKPSTALSELIEKGANGDFLRQILQYVAQRPVVMDVEGLCEVGYGERTPERANAEVKRRTDVVGIFPNEASITRLVGALLIEQNEEWQLQRRYLQLEGLQSLGRQSARSAHPP